MNKEPTKKDILQTLQEHEEYFDAVNDCLEADSTSINKLENRISKLEEKKGKEEKTNEQIALVSLGVMFAMVLILILKLFI